ncbi:MAG TPA: hypothetical protein VIY29_03035 [Ktedonobacteraceae bacterium]
MKGFVFCLLMVFVLALSACGSSSTTAAPPIPTPTQMTNHYTVKLSALNGSGVSGTVDLRLTGKILAVTVNVTGLAPNKIHFQHIHGSHDAASTCPTVADANASGMITVDRALPKIGPVAFSFAPYAPADLHGGVRWSKTFVLDSGVLWAITPLVQHVVVFHGMTSQGVYDNVLPVACGPITAVSG